MTAIEMIETLRRIANDLERMSQPSGATAAPVPAPAPSGGWKRARLGKVFLNPTDKGTVRAAVYLNYLEDGEEKTDKPSTFDEELIAQLGAIPPRANVEYQTEVNKKGYLNLVAIRVSGR